MHQLLEWQGPFSWVTTSNAPCVLDPGLPIGALPGVYLWTVPYDGGNLIYYVGQTATPLRKRLASERRKLECGYDYLPDPELLKQGRKTFLYQRKRPVCGRLASSGTMTVFSATGKPYPCSAA